MQSDDHEPATEMLLVVDASVVLEACLAGGALGPLTGHELRAPGLLPSEVASALHELAWRGDIPPHHGWAAVGLLTQIPLRLELPGSLSASAWEIADRLGWAKTYDAEYVALALQLGCPLVTADARLQRGAARLVTTIEPAALQ